MQSKKPRTTRGKPKRKPKRPKGKRASPADPKERLKPISLHGMELDDVFKKLLRRAPE
jgi:hypothetical protein